MSDQRWFKCSHCGFERAIYDEDGYTKSWHCDICGYQHSEPGDELRYEFDSDAKAIAYVHSEWGRNRIPKELTIIKSEKLASFINEVIALRDERIYSLIEYILPFLRFKYKITNKYTRDKKLSIKMQQVFKGYIWRGAINE